MSNQRFKNFLKMCIDDNFSGDCLCLGFAWTNCTAKQAEKLKAAAIESGNYEIVDGRVKVGPYTFRE